MAQEADTTGPGPIVPTLDEKPASKFDDWLTSLHQAYQSELAADFVYGMDHCIVSPASFANYPNADNPIPNPQPPAAPLPPNATPADVSNWNRQRDFYLRYRSKEVALRATLAPVIGSPEPVSPRVTTCLPGTDRVNTVINVKQLMLPLPSAVNYPATMTSL